MKKVNEAACTITETASPAKSNVTLYGVGKLFLAIADPADSHTTITAESLAEFGETMFTPVSILAASDRVYGAVSAMCTLREMGDAIEPAELAASEAEARSAVSAFLKMAGTRPARKKGNAARPLYSCTTHDLVIMGENCEAARNDNTTKGTPIDEAFLYRLILSTARLINGEPLKRLTADDLAARRKAANEEAAKKRKETRAANKEAAEAAEKEHEEAIEAERDKTAAALQTANDAAKKAAIMVDALAELGKLISASHATDEEKAAMYALINRAMGTETTTEANETEANETEANAQ